MKHGDGNDKLAQIEEQISRLTELFTHRRAVEEPLVAMTTRRMRAKNTTDGKTNVARVAIKTARIREATKEERQRHHTRISESPSIVFDRPMRTAISRKITRRFPSGTEVVPALPALFRARTALTHIFNQPPVQRNRLGYAFKGTAATIY
jgi:hypothetical protein